MQISAYSPGVFTKEIDLTGIVPAVSTTEAGIAGQFNWGPVNDPTLIESETDLLSVFGKPTNEVAIDWFSAANFLAYGNVLWTVRVVDELSNTGIKAANAVSANTGYLVRNDVEYAEKYNGGELKTSHATGEWIAKYAGKLGNSIKISVCPTSDAYQSTLAGSITANNVTVTGSATSFLTQVSVGDIIQLGTESRQVSAVVSNTSITVSEAFSEAHTGVTGTRFWEYYASFDAHPTTSGDTASKGGSDDEMHIIVLDSGGEWTGQKGTVLEKFPYVSKGRDAKLEDGSTNFYKEIVNQKSRFIRWAGHSTTIPDLGKQISGTAFQNYVKPLYYQLKGGLDGTQIGNAEKIRGYSYFLSPEDLEISIIIGSSANQTVSTYIINNIVEVRKDCVVFLSPPQNTVINNVGGEVEALISYRNTLPSTSYAFLDSGWKYQYDKYNDLYRYVPLNGDIAGIHVRSDQDRDAWWAAAGFNRGQVKNVVRLAWNPKQADRDLLYKKNINPVSTFPSEGTVLFGQKTLLNKPSAFDRMNVRRLFIVLRKAVSRAAKYFLFEFNDEITRAQFRSMVEPYLRDIQGRRGIYDFKVVCDRTNNPGEVVDRNEFVADIYIKPTRVAEFIQLNFVAVRTAVDFSEIVDKVGTF